MKILLNFKLTIILLTLFTQFGLSQNATSSRKKILILHSVEDVRPWNIKYNENLRIALKNSTIADSDVSIEYLDLIRYNSDEHKDLLEKEILTKYQNHLPDVIVLTQIDAVRFVYDRKIFPEIPKILVDIDDDGTESFPNSTIIKINYNFESKIKHALSIFPKTKEIYVVAGNSKIDHYALEIFKKETSTLKGKLVFKYLENLDKATVLNRIRNLPENSLVYSLPFTQDLNGEAVMGQDFNKQIAKNSNRPVFSFNDLMSDRSGIFGGLVVTMQSKAEKTVEVLEQVLSGQRIENIRPVDTKETYQYDWIQIKKWNVDIDTLPKESVFFNQSYTFFELHRNETIIGIILLIFYTILLLLLLYSNQKRKKSALDLSLKNNEYEAINEKLKLTNNTLKEAKEIEEEHKKNVIKANERLEAVSSILNNDFNSEKELLDYTLLQAVNLTNSKIGYIYYYNEEKKEFTLNTWSGEVMKECNVMDPKTTYQLDSTGCWGEAVRQRKAFVINDYSLHNEYKKGTPEGHVQLKKFLTLPVIIENEIKAVVGVGNKESDYNDDDNKQLSLLMNAVWKIVQQKQHHKDLIKEKERAEESDRLKSAFLANMSHEIRTPMNGILGFASLLQEPNLSDKEQLQYINIIQNSGKRLLNTVNDIIDISKIESGQTKLSITEVKINEKLTYLNSFFNPEAAKKGIQLIFKNEILEQDISIETDAEKLYSILTNLIKNAIKFTNEGFIELGCNIKKKEKYSELEFYVKDSGIGIPKDRQSAIFDRFIQADIEDKMARQGSGLGLAISKAYTEMLGGKIWVESEVNKGSTFYFTIPYSFKAQTTKSESENTYNNNYEITNKLKILIAEDDENSEKFLTTILSPISSHLLIAKNGDEAVNICKLNSDIDLILMDMQMPILNGYEATQQIRLFNKAVKIIAQTAFALSGDEEKVIEAGCNAYIKKPINIAELISMINSLKGKP